MSRKILLTGRNGKLASALLPDLPRDRTVTTTSTANAGEETLRLDLARPDDFDYGVIGADDLVLHAAGLSAPDVCRDRPDLAWSVNVDGTAHFIGECLRRGARVVFFSSDVVYGGTGDNQVDEDSPCDPQEPYAHMKREVERQFIGREGFLALRLSYVVSSFDKFTGYLNNCVAEGREAEIIRSFERSPVAFSDLRDAVLALALGRQAPAAVVNVCGPETLSRMAMARAFQAAFAPEMRLREIPAPDGFFDSRPPKIRVRSKHLPSLLGRAPLTLADYYRQLAGMEKRG